MGSVREEIAKNLLFYRKKSGLSQSQLAEKIGVKQKDISRWETGARKPKLETLQKIANACNANIIDLVK